MSQLIREKFDVAFDSICGITFSFREKLNIRVDRSMCGLVCDVREELEVGPLGMCSTK